MCFSIVEDCEMVHVQQLMIWLGEVDPFVEWDKIVCLGDVQGDWGGHGQD
jgi:hypothetical protein